MTVIETMCLASHAVPRPIPASASSRMRLNRRPRAVARRIGPAPARPAGAPLHYRGGGVVTARRTQRARPITPATTVGLAMLAGLITVWLGLIAQFGAAAADPATPAAEQLGVVRVQADESLQQVAARVAPNSPPGRIVARIKELNGLESAAVVAGQTLIAPLE